jgi:drug/metabolite transporter (DMT)-like permease
MRGMKESKTDLVQHRLMLHLAVVLFGFTAILGKLITVNAITLVFWRMVFALGLILVLQWVSGQRFALLEKRDKYVFLTIGFFIGIHWFCFYASVKMAHVSVALICMALTPMFTSLIEPLVERKTFERTDLLFSLLTVPLIYFLIGGIIGFNMLGFVMGILAAFFAALFSVMNKKMVKTTDNNTLMFYEFTGVLIISLFTMLGMYQAQKINELMPSTSSDWLFLIILAWLCTNVAFRLTVMAMKKISVFETNLIIGLEPLYGILLAVMIFKEYRFFTTQFYIAAVLIVALVFIYPLHKLKNHP